MAGHAAPGRPPPPARWLDRPPRRSSMSGAILFPIPLPRPRRSMARRTGCRLCLRHALSPPYPHHLPAAPCPRAGHAHDAGGRRAATPSGAKPIRGSTEKLREASRLAGRFARSGRPSAGSVACLTRLPSAGMTAGLRTSAARETDRPAPAKEPAAGERAFACLERNPCRGEPAQGRPASAGGLHRRRLADRPLSS